MPFATPETLADVWNTMRAAGEGERLPGLRRRLLSLQLRTAAVERQRLMIVECATPLRAAGWWMPELAELVGADLVVSRKGFAPQPFSWADSATAAADLVVYACSGRALADNVAAARLCGHATAPLYAVDARVHFSTPGAALVETAEILAEILHQDPRLHFGHRGIAWQVVAR